MLCAGLVKHTGIIIEPIPNTRTVKPWCCHVECSTQMCEAVVIATYVHIIMYSSTSFERAPSWKTSLIGSKCSTSHTKFPIVRDLLSQVPKGGKGYYRTCMYICRVDLSNSNVYVHLIQRSWKAIKLIIIQIAHMKSQLRSKLQTNFCFKKELICNIISWFQ